MVGAAVNRSIADGVVAEDEGLGVIAHQLDAGEPVSVTVERSDSRRDLGIDVEFFEADECPGLALRIRAPTYGRP